MREVYVIERATGCYDNYRTVCICAYLDKDRADSEAVKAEAEFRAACVATPSRGWPDNDCSEADWDSWEAERLVDWERFKAMLTVDPSISPAGAWSEPEGDLAYFVTSVPLKTAKETT